MLLALAMPLILTLRRVLGLSLWLPMIPTLRWVLGLLPILRLPLIAALRRGLGLSLGLGLIAWLLRLRPALRLFFLNSRIAAPFWHFDTLTVDL